METVKFLGPYVAAKVINEERKTAGGILVSVNTRKSNCVHAIVKYVGDECVGKTEVGDEIVFDRNFGTELVLGENEQETLQIVRESGIYVVIKRNGVAKEVVA